jgi:hypothetical protein
VALEPKVTHIDHLQRLTARGNIEPVVRVQFFVGTHGPFFAEFKDADFNDTNVNAHMRKFAETLNRLPVETQ